MNSTWKAWALIGTFPYRLYALCPLRTVSSNGAASITTFGLTTALKTSALRCRYGWRKKAFIWNIYSLTSPIRLHIEHDNRKVRLEWRNQHISATITAPIWRSAASHLQCYWKWPRLLTRTKDKVSRRFAPLNNQSPIPKRSIFWPAFTKLTFFPDNSRIANNHRNGYENRCLLAEQGGFFVIKGEPTRQTS